MSKITFISLVLLLVPSASFGQLTIESNTLQYYVEDVLTNYANPVSNFYYSGFPSAISVFHANVSNMPFQRGIVITTGTAFPVADGPQGPNGSASSGQDNGGPENSLLNQLNGNIQTHNAALLRFDIVPNGDTMKLRYVFGSEEYPEYVGSSYNDPFGIFISGPGITGTYNMATLPNGNPVTINNVNNGPANGGPCHSCANYINNGNGTNAPYNHSDTYLQYDGLTVPLTASCAVIPGETYHVTIIIADAGDGLWDSGLFIEASSLTTSLDENVLNSMVTVFPNPATDQLEFKLDPANPFVAYEILDLCGKRLKHDQLAGTTTANISQLPAGSYFVRFISPEGNVTRKVEKL